jgi:UDP-glucose 4-epimerase
MACANSFSHRLQRSMAIRHELRMTASISPYGWSKLMMEIMLLRNQARHLRHTLSDIGWYLYSRLRSRQRSSCSLGRVAYLRAVSTLVSRSHRAGPSDPAQIVAASDRIRMTLGWNPQYDHLATIVTYVLAWGAEVVTICAHAGSKFRVTI